MSPTTRARAFVAISSATPLAVEALPDRDDRSPARPIVWTTSEDRRLAVGICPRDTSALPSPGPWSIGDEAELTPGVEGDESVVNAVTIALDGGAGDIHIATSIVSLPPVFVLRQGSMSFACSDLHLLSRLPDVELYFDPEGLCDLGRIGFPVGGRTLFRDVRFADAASRIRLTPDEDIHSRPSWRYPRDADPLSWPDFVELQIEAFEASMDQLDVEHSVLSLTGGLDTRAIFAVLAHQDRLRPSVTLSGSRPSLDARIAGELCRHYGVDHQVIHYDDRYLQDLPRRVADTSRLSGGLATLDWASEVYLYEALEQDAEGRVSGNLGNQVGRGGTEGFGTRGADVRVLAPGLAEAGGVREGHWMDEARTPTGIDPEFLLHREIPVTSVGNFCIGNHFAVQQSPYANRRLVESIAYRPLPEDTSGGSLVKLRLRDLRHRFLGEPEAHSFQRRLIHRLDGFAAQCPINWGWRASGGVSARGSLRGALTLLGMLASSRGLDEGPLSSWVEPVVSLHDFRRRRHWLRTSLREFSNDVLRSDSLRAAGLFDAALLDRTLDEHFGGSRDHYETVVFALDTALAHEHFGARVG